jgi:hypothetical protein
VLLRLPAEIEPLAVMADDDAAGLVRRPFRSRMAVGATDNTKLDPKEISHQPLPDRLRPADISKVEAFPTVRLSKQFRSRHGRFPP